MRLRILILLFGLGVVFSGLWAYGEFADRRFRQELRQAQRAFGERRIGVAHAQLTRLSARRPGESEVEYWLGSVEMVRGHDAAALAAWARVPENSKEAPLAAMSRGRLGLETGRYQLAEKALTRASREPGEFGQEGRRLLGRLYWMMGRRGDQRLLMQGDAEQLADPSELLRSQYMLDHDQYPVTFMEQALEEARKANPADDRVWLALADLARRKGQFDEADEWLARCERARPQDLAVWSARLEWARSAGRPDELARAARHLPGSDFAQAHVLRLRAWLAARRGDRRAERAALEELITLEPAESAALERVADLVAQDGEVEHVAALRRQKAASDGAHDRYRTLINVGELAPHAVELARAAERVGRWFDAKTWWQLAARRDSAVKPEAGAALARLAMTEPPAQPARSVLLDLLGPVREDTAPRSGIASDVEIPTFGETASERGLAFMFDNGQTPKRQLPETTSGGVAVLDFDGDGWLDVYAIQGGPFPPATKQPPFGDRLYRNRGDGTFEDVTASSGLGGLPGGYGHGAAVGDYDNDGRPDLFVTRWRSYALYHNLGGGRFEDATVRAGFAGERDWPTSAAWADLDNDGDLDLYVCHYLKWDAQDPPLCNNSGNSGAPYVYCDPRPFASMPDHVFRNDGGRFVDVTADAGIVDTNGRGLGVLAADLDEDGKIDLFVANDTTANYFFQNQGGFRFVERGIESGLATSASGGNLAGMGIACGDFNGDGRFDVAVTNFYEESTTLYHNHGGGLFSDRALETGLAGPTRYVLGFGLAALDANNDGLLDLVQANGHVADYRPRTPYAMPPQLFLGTEAHKLIDVSSRAGPDWSTLRIGRGLAVGDIDNDGRMDVLIVCGNDLLALFHNESGAGASQTLKHAGHFLTLSLEGTVSNRDAVGARVAVTVSGRTQVATRFGGGSFLSASDARLHFGLGRARTVDCMEVWWPSGRHDRYSGLAADTGYKVREGSPVAGRLTGFPAATR
jgi:tetratricopeptide (TPR) repeat protein